MAATTFAFANNNNSSENELNITKQELVSQIILKEVERTVTCSVTVNGITWTVTGRGNTVAEAVRDCAGQLNEVLDEVQG